MEGIGGWWTAIEPWFRLFLPAGVGFLVGNRLEHRKARRQLQSQAMASITQALDRVEGIAGDLKVRLSIVYVDDKIVISNQLSLEERKRLEVEIGGLRELAGTLARFPELSRAAELMAEKASFVLHFGDDTERTGIEFGQVTSARHGFDGVFKDLVRAKDQAVKSIL